ncbi:YihY/virulence factor BrkB family protein [Streptomyces diacarni]|uniref:YihY/virulence factor BrkB family protein n=1 Tax=Streptomyces diacarni TaxID=2800381 RepID=A0A367ETR9_9ACTN|nr:YihY/virulence factor BrkB family protein [Streptomyces diacarni]RCG21403.1 YihY/virulence factor BrkB family protein [Streptomyces diacarni]
MARPQPPTGGTTPPPHRDWRTALRRTPVSMWNDDVSDWAAALTYYAILALLPALLVTVSLIGLVSPAATDELIEHITAWAPAQAGESLHQVLRNMADERSAALTVVIVGGVSAMWSASSYLAVFRRALHAMHAVEDQRPVLRKAHRIVLTALAALGLLVASALVLTLSGPVAQTIGRWMGMGGTGAVVWALFKWPVLLCLVTLLVVVVFRTGPATPLARRYRLAGGILAALLWLVASAGFTLYASLSAYSRLYGSLAGIVVFLIWLWLSNLSLLAGAQFMAELTRPHGKTGMRAARTAPPDGGEGRRESKSDGGGGPRESDTEERDSQESDSADAPSHAVGGTYDLRGRERRKRTQEVVPSEH